MSKTTKHWNYGLGSAGMFRESLSWGGLNSEVVLILRLLQSKVLLYFCFSSPLTGSLTSAGTYASVIIPHQKVCRTETTEVTLITDQHGFGLTLENGGYDAEELKDPPIVAHIEASSPAERLELKHGIVVTTGKGFNRRVFKTVWRILCKSHWIVKINVSTERVTVNIRVTE